MAEPDAAPRTPRLPDSAPEALREFVACRSMSVRLDTAELGWIPVPDGVPASGAPDVTVQPGSTPTTATLRVGYGEGGFIGFDLPVAIVDGQLSVDAGNLPFGIGDSVDRWVRDFNATMTANDKELDSFAVDGSAVTATKRAVVASSGPVGTAPVAAVADASGTKSGGMSNKQKGGLAAAAVVIFGSLGVGYAVTRDDASGPSDDFLATVTPTPAAAPTPTPDDASDPEPIATPEPEPEPGVTPTPGPDPTPTPDVSAGLVLCGDPGSLFTDPGEPYTYAPCDTPPGDGWVVCPTGFPCWDVPGSPLMAFGGRATDHSGSVADAVTGNVGNSKALFALLARIFGFMAPTWTGTVQSDCGGSTLTGASAVDPDGLTIIEQPLLNYGACSVVDTTISDGVTTWHYPPQVWDGGADYVIDNEVGAPPAPDATTLSWPTDGFVDPPFESAGTIRNLIGDGPEAADCSWLITPAVASRLPAGPGTFACSQPERAWAWAAGIDDATYTDQIAGYGGAANVVAYGGGLIVPTVPDGASDDSPFVWIDQDVFPCGLGHAGFTACSPDATPLPPGPMVVVQSVYDTTIMTDGNGDGELDDDGADRTFQTTFGPDDIVWYFDEDGSASSVGARTADGSELDTAARAVIRGNSITLLIPAAEMSGASTVTVSTTIDGATLEQPAIPMSGFIESPVAAPEPDETEPTPTPAPPPPPTESIDAFYQQLSPSVASGDLGFALDRLHPDVIGAYSEQECRDALTTFADPELQITFLGEVGTEPWIWLVTDGTEYPFDEATTVSISLTGRGQSGDPVESHLVDIDGHWHWFTYCE